MIAAASRVVTQTQSLVASLATGFDQRLTVVKDQSHEVRFCCDSDSLDAVLMCGHEQQSLESVQRQLSEAVALEQVQRAEVARLQKEIAGLRAQLADLHVETVHLQVPSIVFS